MQSLASPRKADARKLSENERGRRKEPEGAREIESYKEPKERKGSNEKQEEWFPSSVREVGSGWP